jgi:hypothetical protein
MPEYQSFAAGMSENARKATGYDTIAFNQSKRTL